MSRVEFLRGVSRLVLDSSGCDSLEFRFQQGQTRFRWCARCQPRETFDLQVLESRPGGCSADRAALWLDDLVERVLQGEVGAESGTMTERRSLWTSNVANDLALKAMRAEDGVHPLPGSLAVIPFEAGDEPRSVLVLSSERKDFFSAENVASYEALAQTLGLAIDDRRAQYALRERVKELSCLYAIDRILEVTDATITESLTKVARLLPPAWQFPDIAVARICLDGAEFATGDMGRTLHRHEAAIVTDGAGRGSVQVGYLEERPELLYRAFLEEEEHLIAAIAREISLFVQKHESQAQKQKLADQIRQADRLATIGQLAAGIAHEVNEPLGGILGFAQLARKVPGNPDSVAKDLDKIIQAALYAREIVRKLMLFARQSPARTSALRVNEVVEESLALLAARLREHRIQAVCDFDPANPVITADRVQLHQIVVNLCVNAIQAMPAGGKLIVRTRRLDNGASVAVEDTGAGIPLEIAERVFEPFFTTKDPEHGTGLGLSVVQGIVTSYGGTIGFESTPGAGTRFEVRLPKIAPSHDREAHNG
jgi:C4-dicarboxylate-specific signal transduction histidine kinase